MLEFTQVVECKNFIGQYPLTVLLSEPKKLKCSAGLAF